MLRGGSFNNNQRNVRVSYRNNNNPNNRNNNIGFRLVAHAFRPTGNAMGRRCVSLLKPPKTQVEVRETA